MLLEWDKEWGHRIAHLWIIWKIRESAFTEIIETYWILMEKEPLDVDAFVLGKILARILTRPGNKYFNPIRFLGYVYTHHPGSFYFPSRNRHKELGQWLTPKKAGTIGSYVDIARLIGVMCCWRELLGISWDPKMVDIWDHAHFLVPSYTHSCFDVGDILMPTSAICFFGSFLLFFFP